ncbi:hypothetical protein Leryth_002330 [Lithospermum erythrorhizon]|nr:hypothetical protein Leryth_002330 [Lithospermum erythrorhizon]
MVRRGKPREVPSIHPKTKGSIYCILETLGAGLGGWVELTRKYHQALDASVSRNFPDNGIIACISHNTDALYCSKQTAVVRASDDIYPRVPHHPYCRSCIQLQNTMD